MNPKIAYIPCDDSDLVRITINDVAIGPELLNGQMCAVRPWIETSWPFLVVAVLATNVATKKRKVAKVTKLFEYQCKCCGTIFWSISNKKFIVRYCDVSRRRVVMPRVIIEVCKA